MNIKEYLESKSCQFKGNGKEVRTTCLFCEDDKTHLYVNVEKKLYHCKKCGEAGNLTKLQKHFGDWKPKPVKETYVKPKPSLIDQLTSSLGQEAIDYLTKERGFTNEIIREFKLGFKDGYISIPYYKNREIVNVKYKPIDPTKEYTSFKNGESVLYNIDNIDKSQPVIITEGEFDCIAAIQLGFKNVISISNGAQTFKDVWADELKGCKIYLAYDNDKAGDKGSDIAAGKLENCWRVKLPEKDFNDCLMGGFNKVELQYCLNGAKEYNNISNLSGTKLNHKVVEKILSEHILINCIQDFYEYINGVYILKHISEIHHWIMDIIGEKRSCHIAKEIISILEHKCFVYPEKVNASNMANLKNCMLNLKPEPEHDPNYFSKIITKHDPKYLSTIQLDINYDSEAYPTLWLKTLGEILNDEKDIMTLQEFFGLCLTKEVWPQKALFLVGEGANGKSVVTYILERLVGLSNRSCIPIEKFGDERLLASLYGKLVNICSETSAKGYIYDSNIKAIISGESISVHPKYKKEFDFSPFCKLIVTTNNLPKIEDKTNGFYRRFEIIRFDREFAEHEQNKSLKYQLEEELSGILLWAISGLRRLRKNKFFTVSDKSIDYKTEYKKSNNYVILFVEECCQLAKSLDIDKNYIYEEYDKWCDKSGYKALGKNNFGKELLKQYKNDIFNIPESRPRKWGGITLL
jgi:P4 family phage/plasmid primase-like protien